MKGTDFRAEWREVGVKFDGLSIIFKTELHKNIEMFSISSMLNYETYLYYLINLQIA